MGLGRSSSPRIGGDSLVVAGLDGLAVPPTVRLGLIFEMPQWCPFSLGQG